MITINSIRDRLDKYFLSDDTFVIAKVSGETDGLNKYSIVIKQGGLVRCLLHATVLYSVDSLYDTDMELVKCFVTESIFLVNKVLNGTFTEENEDSTELTEIDIKEETPNNTSDIMNKYGLVQPRSSEAERQIHILQGDISKLSVATNLK